MSQTAAFTSATSAAASATAAATSASSAATSATSSANSATNAATSASSSLTTYNTYKTYYLGTFATAPTLDNQGNALINGATYFNSANNTMFVYSTSTTTWSAISSTSSVTNVLGTAGNITSTGGTAPTINLATAGTAGTYAYPNTLTTDAYGRITSATTGTATGSGNHVLQTSPNLTTPSIASATLTGTLTAGGGVGTSGYYLQTTGTGVQWSAVSSYTAPTIGTTSIGSGATVSSIAGLTSLALNYTGTSTNVGTLSVGGATSISDTGLMATFVGNSATYAYQLTQNTSSGASSYTTITAANNGYTSYVSLGVNSTTYNYATAGFPNNAFSLPSANFIEADNGDLAVGTWSNNPIHFVVNGVAATTDVMTMTSSLVSTTVPITATKYQQLDGAGYVIDIALMGIMGAW